MTYISMSQKELNRHDVIKRAIRKEITTKKAGELLNLCKRQIYRLKAKVKEEGAKGLIHGNKGRPSNRRIPEEERQRIVKLLHKHYHDFKPTHATEKLSEEHNIKRDPKTIRQIMIDEGLWVPKKRKGSDYRSKRPRKEHYGEMEQFDGSYEHWFEDRAPKCCLLASIDDATGTLTQAKFAKHEGVFPVFNFWKEYLLNHGKPRSIYLDKLRTYFNNHPSAIDDKDMLTQFQRAMKELAIETIPAHSPQAKGRVERLFNTLQDRLIKELRLRGISDIETANQFLEKEFIPWFNEKYSVQPKKEGNLHQKLTKKEKKELPSILSRQSQRVIQNDFTVRFQNNYYQLTKKQPATIRSKQKVIIEQRLDGSVKIRFREKYLNFKVLTFKPRKNKGPQPWIIPASQPREKASVS